MKWRNIWPNLKVPIKVSVLGCAVNGPGEAREADIGIAGRARGRDAVPLRGDDPQSAGSGAVSELKKEIDADRAQYTTETGEIPGRKVHQH